ncbi:type II toxin-antitoxin system PemK/MazF family toxin [Clostridium estertheticum]|uniref:type II toxin-antitoxin system PemK/MazF family toxin n=1 Tax=Clostridium estertheticum TaxID=238834 RepID=UPI001CF31E9E|nr:type II toxin-antitoxin system PemK/MazF family toxin [Clostridium estertheticum]MCB2354477.1 type II toxin-antitoxin system PemK/MazF family toxin [Clostridium estertheticum]WAG42410.1 type II toxin-antitoxin system PemK/MazF family toxin [Clostridium estertheticum]
MDKILRRCDIWIVDLKETYKFALKGKHPCLVISNWKACNKSPLIQILPITSKDKLNIPGHVKIYELESGLEHESTILSEQIQTVNRDMFINKIGYCNQLKMEEVQDALSQQLGFTNELDFDMFETIKEKIEDIEELNRFLEKECSIEIIRERDMMIRALSKYLLNNGIKMNLSRYANKSVTKVGL